MPSQVADTARASTVREAGRACDAAHDVVEPDPREDRHAVPAALAVGATS
jgi:hypothetical protein